MTGKKSDKAWLARHVRDPYVKQARRQGYRSRSAFKLIELDERYRILRPGITALDLGSSPGGWSQVAAQRIGRMGFVVGVDLLAMDTIPGVTFIRGDLREPAVRAQLDEALDGRRVDLVLSDMAPNLTGVRVSDAAREQELVEVALSVSTALLRPEGVALIKLFHGSGLDALIARMRTVFHSVVIRKPPASRSRSSEVYALCHGLFSR